MRRRHQLPVGQGENQPRTCIVTFASVWMYTSSLPALLSGESSSIMRHWWQMSGRYSAAFLLFFFRMCAWSSLFSSWKLWPAFTVSRLARSSTTIRRCAVSFSRPLAGRGAVVAMSRAARAGGGSGWQRQRRLKKLRRVARCVLDEGGRGWAAQDLHTCTPIHTIYNTNSVFFP